MSPLTEWREARGHRSEECRRSRRKRYLMRQDAHNAVRNVDNKRRATIGKYFAIAKSKWAARRGRHHALNSFIQNQRLDGFKAAAGGAKFLDTDDKRQR
jgi:hypothetical protein